MACRFLCWYQVGSPGCAHLCVVLLCCVSLRACIGLCVSWCPFLRVASGLIWCWVSSCRVMCRGACCVVACCVVLLCFGALGWTLVCGVGHCFTVLCVVTCRFVALYSMLRCAPLLSCWLWISFCCCRVCCCVLCLGVAWCCCFCFVGCAPLLRHVVPLGYVVLCGLVWFPRGFVVALFVPCGVASRSCVVMLCRIGWRRLVWRRVVAALRRVTACAVLFCCLALGVVVLFCWFCPIVVPCSSVEICRVVWFGLVLPWYCGGVLVAVLCCAALCCCDRCCVPKALLPKGKGRDVYQRVKVNRLGCVCCVRAVCKCVVA